VDMLIKTQSKFAKFMNLGLNSEQRKTVSGDSEHELPKPSEIAMYIETGIALAALFGLLAVGAWVLYSAHDLISSIQRFQEMI
jgi:hypothetical protein